MSPVIPPDHPIRELFSRAVNDAFRSRSDLYSPEIASHLSEEMLPGFVHVDHIYRLRSLGGKPLRTLPGMVDCAAGKEGPERNFEVNLYIGDFVLFMCSFFPTLVRSESRRAPTAMVSRVGGIIVSFSEPLEYYVAEGRNAYNRAARTAAAFDPSSRETCRKLSEKLESYLEVLRMVKSYLEKSAMPGAGAGSSSDNPQWRRSAVADEVNWRAGADYRCRGGITGKFFLWNTDERYTSPVSEEKGHV